MSNFKRGKPKTAVCGLPGDTYRDSGNTGRHPRSDRRSPELNVDIATETVSTIETREADSDRDRSYDAFEDW